MDGNQVVARARSLIGTRFRSQGRVPGVGLDCVGTVAIATGRDAGRIRRDYRLRGETLAALEQGLAAQGLVPVPRGGSRPGDILVMETGRQQLHLAVITPGGFVHADAGIGRVVEGRGAPPWPIIGTWRVNEGTAG